MHRKNRDAIMYRQKGKFNQAFIDEFCCQIELEHEAPTHVIHATDPFASICWEYELAYKRL